MKLVSILLVIVICSIPIATSLLQLSGNFDLICINIEEEQSEKESEESQEDKLIHKTLELIECFHVQKSNDTVPRQAIDLYNLQSFRGVITPPPKVV